MAAYQGKIYCIGGRTYIFNSPALARSLDIVEVYDPITDSWSSKASFPNESAYQAHVVNGQLFVITHYGEMYMYNPATDSWTNRTTIPLERYAFSVVADNKIIVGDHLSIYSMGGGTTFSDRLGIKIYDPKTNRCREGKTSPDLTVFVGSTVGGATTGVYAPKKVYVFGLEFNGGYNTGSGQPFTWVYDPINDSWSTAQAGNSDIAVAINDVLYVIGGTATKQYVPMGYNPQGYPLEHSFFLTNSVRVVTVLIITCVIVTILFFYFKKKHVVRGL
jgi:N-acetylneuraminic acid mutarotase